MKKFLLFCFTFISYMSYLVAQQQPLHIDPVKDRKETNGYTIQTKPALRNTVLFEIFQQYKPLYIHLMNPINMLPEGSITKEDAFKVAVWMIKDYGKQKNFLPSVPPHVVYELPIKNQSTYDSFEN